MVIGSEGTLFTELDLVAISDKMLKTLLCKIQNAIALNKYLVAYSGWVLVSASNYLESN